MTKIWNPFTHLIEKCYDVNYAVLILNTEIKLSKEFLVDLWKNAKIRSTVDGGTDRWLAWLTLQQIPRDDVPPPNFISGDFDSLSAEALDYFVKNQSCEVIHTPNQNETDFTKALAEFHALCQTQNDEVKMVYVVVDTAGRFDQIIANVNTLFKMDKHMGDYCIVQIASDSLTWLLSAGRHEICVPADLRQASAWCALVPFRPVNRLSTTGLKWNLDKSRMEFGGIVSTSNTYDGSSTVTVETDTAIIWSMGILPLLNKSTT